MTQMKRGSKNPSEFHKQEKNINTVLIMKTSYLKNYAQSFDLLSYLATLIGL